VELGIYTFGALTDPNITPQQRIANLIEEIVLADQVGLDVFGVGEHHRPEFTVSAPAASTRAPSRTRCRSGSRSAAPPSRSSGPARSGCRWRWR
jgi:alkanesulfonate monooxygenase SsuD/methylene tetrahydromethanopterin reductase-like flavin-dependent oxidoreductase (luciferase family)